MNYTLIKKRSRNQKKIAIVVYLVRVSGQHAFIKMLWLVQYFLKTHFHIISRHKQGTWNSRLPNNVPK